MGNVVGKPSPFGRTCSIDCHLNLYGTQPKSGMTYPVLKARNGWGFTRRTRRVSGTRRSDGEHMTREFISKAKQSWGRDITPEASTSSDSSGYSEQEVGWEHEWDWWHKRENEEWVIGRSHTS